MLINQIKMVIIFWLTQLYDLRISWLLQLIWERCEHQLNKIKLMQGLAWLDLKEEMFILFRTFKNS